MKRRDFLKVGTAGAVGAIGSASGLLAWTPRASAANISKTYYITDGLITQPDGVDVYFRGFSDGPSGLNVPGSPMIVQECGYLTFQILPILLKLVILIITTMLAI